MADRFSAKQGRRHGRNDVRRHRQGDVVNGANLTFVKIVHRLDETLRSRNLVLKRKKIKFYFILNENRN